MKYTLRYIQRCKPSPKYEVCISCSLFKMNRPYNTFGKYTFRFLKLARKVPKNYYIRLYVDASVLDDKNFISIIDSKIPNLEIVVYEFPDFLTEDEIHHDGTFGTMARFLPLFNKPALPKSIKYVWVTDVDMHPNVFNYDNIKDLKKYKAQTSTFSWACYDKEWIPATSKFPTGAGKIISDVSVKYPFDTFTDFLQDVVDGKYDYEKNKILARLPEGAKHQMLDVKLFPYGFDELYVNTYLTKIFDKYRRLIYYDLTLIRFKDFYWIPHKEEIAETYTKTIMGDFSQETKKKLLELNQDVYDFMKDKEVTSPRLQTCLADFDKYKDSVSKPMAGNWGLSALVIVDPKRK